MARYPRLSPPPEKNVETTNTVQCSVGCIVLIVVIVCLLRAGCGGGGASAPHDAETVSATRDAGAEQAIEAALRGSSFRVLYVSVTSDARIDVDFCGAMDRDTAFVLCAATCKSAHDVLAARGKSDMSVCVMGRNPRVTAERTW